MLDFFYSISKQGTKLLFFYSISKQGTKVCLSDFFFFFWGGGGEGVVGEGGHKDRVLKGIKTNWYEQRT